MKEITKDEADLIRKKLGEELKLHSTFTHIEGVSQLTHRWTDVETYYSKDALLFKIHTTQEERDSERLTKYYIGLNGDYVNDLMDY